MAHRHRKARSLLGRALRSIVTLHGSPEAIALGAAIGVFIAFTPTIGLQMMLGAFVATLVGANRPAAMIPAWITNPVTIPPVYAMTYWLGSFFWGGPGVSEVYHRLVAAIKGLSQFSWYEFHRHFAEFLKVGLDVFVAMWIGGAIVGGICACITYPVVLRAVRGFRRQLEERRRKRAIRRARRDGAAGGPPA